MRNHKFINKIHAYKGIKKLQKFTDSRIMLFSLIKNVCLKKVKIDGNIDVENISVYLYVAFSNEKNYFF